MSIHTLSNSFYRLVVSTRGGCILGLQALVGGRPVALLRQSVEADDTPAQASACFPLVPFGNRVRGNVFSVNGAEYRLQPNVEWDPHCLHGDAWLGMWSLVDCGASFAEMAYEHLPVAGVYAYQARQRFELQDDCLLLSLSVCNLGLRLMPFGLGWHPYFRLDDDTTLKAPARGHWSAGELSLPEHYGRPPHHLNFSRPRRLPRYAVNNGFDGWDGQACLRWPRRRMELSLSVPCSHYFVFIPDARFDPGYARDFFCFEPMSHAADAHHSANGSGLVMLERGQSTSLTLAMRWTARVGPA